jgi:hypothetical protein
VGGHGGERLAHRLETANIAAVAGAPHANGPALPHGAPSGPSPVWRVDAGELADFGRVVVTAFMDGKAYAALVARLPLQQRHSVSGGEVVGPARIGREGDNRGTYGSIDGHEKRSDRLDVNFLLQTLDRANVIPFKNPVMRLPNSAYTCSWSSV